MATSESSSSSDRYLLRQDHAALASSGSAQKKSKSVKAKKDRKNSLSLPVRAGTLLLKFGHSCDGRDSFYTTVSDQKGLVISCPLSDVHELSPEEYELLAAIPCCTRRSEVFTDPKWLREGFDLRAGDRVEIRGHDTIQDGTHGIVRSKGVLDGEEGLWFGIQITGSQSKLGYENEILMPIGNIRSGGATAAGVHTDVHRNLMAEMMAKGKKNKKETPQDSDRRNETDDHIHRSSITPVSVLSQFMGAGQAEHCARKMSAGVILDVQKNQKKWPWSAGKSHQKPKVTSLGKQGKSKKMERWNSSETLLDSDDKPAENSEEVKVPKKTKGGLVKSKSKSVENLLDSNDGDTMNKARQHNTKRQGSSAMPTAGHQPQNVEFRPMSKPKDKPGKSKKMKHWKSSETLLDSDDKPAENSEEVKVPKKTKGGLVKKLKSVEDLLDSDDDEKTRQHNKKRRGSSAAITNQDISSRTGGVSVANVGPNLPNESTTCSWHDGDTTLQGQTMTPEDDYEIPLQLVTWPEDLPSGNEVHGCGVQTQQSQCEWRRESESGPTEQDETEVQDLDCGVPGSSIQNTPPAMKYRVENLGVYDSSDEGVDVTSNEDTEPIYVNCTRSQANSPVASPSEQKRASGERTEEPHYVNFPIEVSNGHSLSPVLPSLVDATASAGADLNMDIGQGAEAESASDREETYGLFSPHGFYTDHDENFSPCEAYLMRPDHGYEDLRCPDKPEDLFDQTYPLDLDQQHTGVCLIIDQFTYDRKGSKKDVFSIIDVFEKKFRFRIDYQHDLSRAAFLVTFRRHHDYMADPRNKVQRFVCFILGHGDERGIMTCVNGQGSQFHVETGQRVDINKDLLPFLSSSRLPTMAGKPKLFFVQACQGHAIEGGQATQVDADPNDGNTGTVDGVQISASMGQMSISVPDYSDILLAFAVSKGFQALRDIRGGSWFIQAVTSIFRDYHEHSDVLSMMTMVSNAVSIPGVQRDDGTEQKESPCIQNSFRKKMYMLKSSG